MIVKVSTEKHVPSVALTVMVAVTGELPPFNAVNAGMFPLPEDASPIDVLEFVHVTVTPAAGVVVSEMAVDVVPAHNDLSEILSTTGVGKTLIDALADVDPHELVTSNVIGALPVVLNVILPGLIAVDEDGEAPPNVQAYVELPSM